MYKKNELLKELGWDDNLINHFLIDDYEDEMIEEHDSLAQVYDTNSMTVTFNTEKCPLIAN